MVTWHAVRSADNSSATLTARGWGAAHVLLGALRPHAQYDVRVRAYNAVGAGPPSAPLTATTLEGGETLKLKL